MRRGGSLIVEIVPKAKNPEKSVCIVAGSATGGKLFESSDVTRTEDGIVGTKSCYKASQYGRHVVAPGLLSYPLHPAHVGDVRDSALLDLSYHLRRSQCGYWESTTCILAAVDIYDQHRHRMYSSSRRIAYFRRGLCGVDLLSRSALLHGTRLYVPDIGCILGNGPVA